MKEKIKLIQEILEEAILFGMENECHGVEVHTYKYNMSKTGWNIDMILIIRGEKLVNGKMEIDWSLSIVETLNEISIEKLQEKISEARKYMEVNRDAQMD